MSTRIPILFCSPSASDLYEVQGEDQSLIVYDWTFVATALDGRTFTHHTHAVRGAVRSPEGFMVPNFAHRQEAEAFATRVEARRSIDPTM